MGNGARVLLAVSVWLAGRLRLLGPTPAAIKLIDWADKTTTFKIIELRKGWRARKFKICFIGHSSSTDHTLTVQFYYNLPPG